MDLDLPSTLQRLETLATEGLAPAIRYSTSPQENTTRALHRQLELFREILDLLQPHLPPASRRP